MTTTFFTSSQNQDSGTIWIGANGDAVNVAPGVNLTDSGAGESVLWDEFGSATAQVNGFVMAEYVPLIFGAAWPTAVSGTATIQIGTGGLVASTNNSAIQIDQDAANGSYTEQITNAGVIEGATQGIVSSAKGTITNNGTIYAGDAGVDNYDSKSTDTVRLYNHGTISAGQDGVADFGAHIAYVYNSGSIDGGPPNGSTSYYAVVSAATVQETLINYATGTLSGGVDLKGTATVTNQGSISGGITLEGAATLDNSGTMDQVSFTGLASFSSFTNSGLLTGGLTTHGASFTADNSGTIDGSVSLTGTGASLTDSGTIKRGVSLAGSASSTSVVHITSTGVVTGPGNGLAVLAGAYDIANAGEIQSSFTGVDLNGGGKFVNQGTIVSASGGACVYNAAAEGATAYLYNFGSINGSADGLEDIGGHSAYVYNSGAIDGGPTGDAVFSAATTQETLINYATGTLSGGVDLQGSASVTNQGSIGGGIALVGAATLVNDATGTLSGAVDLYSNATVNNEGSINGTTTVAGTATVTNSGTMDLMAFTSTESGSSFTNTGLVSSYLSAAGTSFLLDNSGTIDGFVNLSGDGASLTDSGMIKQGMTLAGSSAAATDARILSTGVVSALPGNTALEVSSGAYDIWSAGDILASGTGAAGVDLNAVGQIVNRGKIAGGSYGVYNSAGAGVAYVYNYGSIDANGVAVYDTGAHKTVIDNYGGLTAGSGSAAVYGGAATVESLYNGGTIDGGVELLAAGSTIVNTRTIDGLVHLLGAGDDFTNEGLVNGDIDFSGTGNVYNGVAGSLTGTIHGSGASSVYYGGNDGETFDMTASGSGLVVGGAGDDTFKFTATGLTGATRVEGGGGTNTLEFTTPGTITASQLFHVSGIEQIDLANGTNNFALANALISTASGDSLTVSLGSGADTINAGGITNSAYDLTIDAGSGVDNIAAGGGADTFVYTSASQSTGVSYDTISGANWSVDKFDLNGSAVTLIDPAVTTGSLSTATFNADLAAAVGASHLAADAAVLFTPSAGTLAGHTFLVVDENAVAGYQAGSDLVFNVTGAKGTLTIGNFV
jgi:hypothetical protein